MQFGSDRHAACVATFAFEEAWRECDVAADSPLVHHVTDGQGQNFGDAEAEEHLRGDEDPIAGVQATNVSQEDSLFSFGQWARARETSAIAEVRLDHGANRVSGCSGPDVVLQWPGFARALAQAVTPGYGA